MDISVVVPVFNEEQNIPIFLKRLLPVLELIGKFEIIFVMDPGSDNTELAIQKAMSQRNEVKYLKLSRRFGQPAATMAGIYHASGAYVVVIDVDLQDPPELISELYDRAREDFDVVYATRNSRDGETWIKKWVARAGYKIINKLSDVQIPVNTGDFRIMSRRVVDELKNLNENHAFLRGLVAYVGFRQTQVYYDRDKRFYGKSNYNKFFGSLKIGLNGLIGFSSKPLTYMSFFGLLISLISFIVGIWYFIQNIFDFNLTPGLSTTVILITFLAGIQLLSLGLLGEYISRIYDQVKNRPIYIVDKKLIQNENVNGL